MSLSERSLKYTRHHYGHHDLQQVGIWEFGDDGPSTTAARRWIIYIHGGAWRDPEILHPTFVPSIDHMLSSGRISSDSVAGFASIDYRLSPHPNHPQDPAETPHSALREARHPDHLSDVKSALSFMRREYGLTDDYILIGHSAGATLAFQLLMDPETQSQAAKVPMPAAIVAISGIYDLVSLDARHDGTYAGFISGAFGEDSSVWKAASPAAYAGSFKQSWPSGKSALLAWSIEDTLIDEPEIDVMAAKLIKDRVDVSVSKDLTEEHDRVWEEGSQLARLVIRSLVQVQEATRCS